MYRRYRRRYYGKSKYSNETTFFDFTKPATAWGRGTSFPVDGDTGFLGIPIVSSTNVYGTRKVKNFDISLTTTDLSSPLVGALVYLPEGTQTSHFVLGDLRNSLYEPNQNVICQFMIPANGPQNAPQITRIRSRLARNMDSGDSIVMLFGNIGEIPAESQFEIAGTVNYAIKF